MGIFCKIPHSIHCNEARNNEKGAEEFKFLEQIRKSSSGQTEAFIYTGIYKDKDKNWHDFRFRECLLSICCACTLHFSLLTLQALCFLPKLH